GDYRAALEFFRRIMRLGTVGEISGQIAPVTYPVVAHAWAAVCLAELGEFAEGATLAAEAVRAAETTNLPWDLGVTSSYEGQLYLHQGALDKAIPALERGVAVCESADLPYVGQQIPPILGCAYALAKRVPEAVHLLDGLGQQPGGEGLQGGESRRATYVSEAYLLIGRLADAVEAAGQAVALARQYKERGREARAPRLLGESAPPPPPPPPQQAP